MGLRVSGWESVLFFLFRGVSYEQVFGQYPGGARSQEIREIDIFVDAFHDVFQTGFFAGGQPGYGDGQGIAYGPVFGLSLLVNIHPAAVKQAWSAIHYFDEIVVMGCSRKHKSGFSAADSLNQPASAAYIHVLAVHIVTKVALVQSDLPPEASGLSGEAQDDQGSEENYHQYLFHV